MRSFIESYYKNSTLIGVVLIMIIFLSLNSFYIMRKEKKKRLQTCSEILIYWLPFIITILFVYTISSFKEDIIHWADNRHQTEIQGKWFFILLSIANNFLLLILTLTFLIQTYKLSNYYYNYLKKHSGLWLIISCITSTMLNISVLLFIFSYIKDATSSFEVLVITQVGSIINMILFLVIDLIVLRLSNNILKTSKIEENNDEKIAIIGFKKAASFAIFNIDLACLLGVLIIIVIQNKLLDINDTIYEYAFSIGGVFFK